MQLNRPARLRILVAGAMLGLFGMVVAFGPQAEAGLTGRIVVAGYGPELPVMQDLGKAFEKTHPGTAVQFEWERTVKAVDLVKAGTAQLAVTDRVDASLKAVQVAWDGIAVIVNFANPLQSITTPQVKGLFTGDIARWSQLDGANVKVDVIRRPPEDNVTPGFEASLDIVGKIDPSSRAVRTDQKALSAVSGKDAAVTYISLAAALKAQEEGIPIRVLTVDNVEPGEPTLKDGRYKIRRPVFFLTSNQPDPLTQAFVEFVRSSDGQKLLPPTFVPLDRSESVSSPAKVQLLESQRGPS